MAARSRNNLSAPLKNLAPLKTKNETKVKRTNEIVR